MLKSNQDGQYRFLLHHLVSHRCREAPHSIALIDGDKNISYFELQVSILKFATGIRRAGLKKGDRVGVFTEKNIEFVTAVFGTSAATGIFVPINPQLRAQQTKHIIDDCRIRFLIVSEQRMLLIESLLAEIPSVEMIIVIPGDHQGETRTWSHPTKNIQFFQNFLDSEVLKTDPQETSNFLTQFDGQMTEIDPVAIFYTSGSTGRPKGVVLSQRNMVVGAASVATYLENNSRDILLAALPLSFDAGFTQLTTAFYAGAQVVLLNYIFPQEIVQNIVNHKVTGLTGVPPLWMQIVDSKWPENKESTLRYMANTGGKMPLDLLQKMRLFAPQATPYLMYGLTEAFRATYLPPEHLDKRPHSIGQAIPNNEVFILNERGQVCAPGEVGQLVQRGPLVSLGYWNDPIRTAEKFRTIPLDSGRVPREIPHLERVVFSGDLAYSDEEGFLYFVGRKDEMLKTSGYRISPAEIEEIVYTLPGVTECCAFGVDHEILGHEIGVALYGPTLKTGDDTTLLKKMRNQMPSYMLPKHIVLHNQSLPRNSNGKIDRLAIRDKFCHEKNQIEDPTETKKTTRSS